MSSEKQEKRKNQAPDQKLPDFDTMYKKLTTYRVLFLMLLNWLFGRQYTGRETVRFRNTEGTVVTDGASRPRRADTFADVTDLHGITEAYAVECQLEWKKALSRRVGEYAVVFTKSDLVKSERITVMFPHPGVLYLGTPIQDADGMEMHVSVGSQEVYSCPVRVGQLAALTCEDIIQNNLIMLIPFYPLKYRRRFRQLEKDEDARGNFLAECRRLYEFLNHRYEDGGLDAEVYSQVQHYIHVTILRTTAKNPILRKELEETMNEILDYQSPIDKLLAKHQQELESQDIRHQQELESRDVKHQQELESKDLKHQQELDEMILRAKAAGASPELIKQIFAPTN